MQTSKITVKHKEIENKADSLYVDKLKLQNTVVSTVNLLKISRETRTFFRKKCGGRTYHVS
jgi:hypothetical protein